MMGVGLVVLILILIGTLTAFVIAAVRAEDQDPTPAAQSPDVFLLADAAEEAKYDYAPTSSYGAMPSLTVGDDPLPADRVLILAAGLAVFGLLLGLLIAAGPSIQRIIESAQP
jgi:ABC-type Na+ efflux pump permease subunit